MLLLRAWLSITTWLTEPIDPKNLRMRPTPASADVISGHHYQNPSRRDVQRPTFKSEVGWRKAKREKSAMTEPQRVAILTGAARWHRQSDDARSVGRRHPGRRRRPRS